MYCQESNVDRRGEYRSNVPQWQPMRGYLTFDTHVILRGLRRAMQSMRFLARDIIVAAMVYGHRMIRCHSTKYMRLMKKPDVLFRLRMITYPHRCHWGITRSFAMFPTHLFWSSIKIFISLFLWEESTIDWCKWAGNTSLNPVQRRKNAHSDGKWKVGTLLVRLNFGQKSSEAPYIAPGNELWLSTATYFRKKGYVIQRVIHL